MWSPNDTEIFRNCGACHRDSRNLEMNKVNNYTSIFEHMLCYARVTMMNKIQSQPEGAQNLGGRGKEVEHLC